MNFSLELSCALLELVTPAQWEYKESHLLPTIRRGLAGLSLQQQYAGAGADCYHIDKTTNYYNTTLEYWSGEEMKIYFFLGKRLDLFCYMTFL